MVELNQAYLKLPSNLAEKGGRTFVRMYVQFVHLIVQPYDALTFISSNGVEHIEIEAPEVHPEMKLVNQTSFMALVARIFLWDNSFFVPE